MKQKKLVALGLASLMVASNVCMAFGADSTSNPANGNITGAGSIEGYIVQDVFTVTLPTVDNANFAFNLDPQELLRLSGSKKTIDTVAADTMVADSYGSKILFADSANYVTKSKDITIVNKSSYAVDVKVDITFSGLTKDGDDGYTIGIVDKTADGYTAGKNTDLYMSLTTTPGTLTGTTEAKTDASKVVSAINNAKYTTTTTLAAAPNTAFAVTGTSKSDYRYALKGTSDLASIAFSQVTYNLSGELNVNGDWTNFNKDASAALSYTFAYTVDKHVDGLSDGDTVNVSSGATTTTFKIAGTKAPKSVWNTKYQLSGASITGNTVTLTSGTDVNSTYLFNTPGTYPLTVVLDDESKITINVVVAK